MQHLDDNQPSILIQSVQRAAALLKVFDNGPTELGVSELSRKAHLHKSTASRLLATMEREGLLERVPGKETYRLGFMLVRLAGQVTHFGDLRTAARPVLVELAELSRETVNLAVLDGDSVINIEQISGPHLVRDTNWVGRHTPLHCVANGKALLAFCAPAAIEQLLQAPLPRYTDRTLTDRTQLRMELSAIRERGYAQALGEIEAGLNAVAAPVRSGTAVIAAVSISGPAYRVTAERVGELGGLALLAAAKIANRIGG